MDFKEIDKKWQKKWEKSRIFKSKEDSDKKKFYCLEMFPYPSGSGLHMGHAFNYTIGDIYARFKRMKGFNVLYPMGYDSFGLPAENAAIKAKENPREYTENAINHFINQQKSLGLSYDWDRLVITHKPEYYKWNQYFFLKFFEKELVYRKKAPVNYCSECNTVLANEQVHNGKCWRHTETDVEIKQLEQWFLKITDYAQELLDYIDGLKWPERIKIMQKNWIGESEGTLVKFKIKDSDEEMPIFTTRIDTLYGVTFMVYAPEHPKVMELVKNTKYEKDVKKFINKVVLEDRYSRAAEDKEKEGMFIGRYAINPINNEEVPIYIANFVLPEYGGGAVMAVPAHDQRDFEFAKRYGLKIKLVIKPDFDLDSEKMNRAYIGDGSLINSDKFNGMNNREAIKEITKYLAKEKIGKKIIEYKLKDWLISRQRYWGTPIPIIYCEKCGIVAENNLPVLLPENVKFGIGNPLETNKEFLSVKCPKCNSKARREIDTMDTFFDSSWYFLRYCDNKNEKEPFDKNKVKYWMPVDQYIGGAEHACMHLIYARFFVKALRDLGFLKINEPFTKLFNQGMLHGEDGAVMSKSRGNVVLPEEFSNKYGIDTARVFLVSIASPDKDIMWSDKGAEGAYRFLNKLISLKERVKSISNKKDKHVESKINRLIIEVEKDIEEFNYNIAIINIMELVNYLNKNKENISKKIYDDSFENLLLVLSPFAPHLCEELYEVKNKGFISRAEWPVYDKSKINYELEYEDEFLSDVVRDVYAVLKLVKIEKPKKIILSVADTWKYKLYKDVRDVNSRDLKTIIGELKVTDTEKIKIIVNLIKKGIPDFILDKKTELRLLEEEKRELEKEFRLEIEISENDDKAMPGKVAIRVE